MKKFVKVSLILSGIFMALGIVLCLISTIVGGKKLVYMISQSDDLDEKVEVAVNQVLGLLNEVTDGEWFPAFDGEFHILDEQGNLPLEDASYVVPLADVKNLEIAIGAGEVTIEEKELADGNIEIEVSGIGTWEYHIEDDTLCLNAFEEVITTLNAGEISIKIPKGSYFEEAEVKVGAGVLELTDMNVKELEAHIGAGEVVMRRIQAEEFAAEVNAGNLRAKEISSVNAELSVDLGECIYEGSISGNLEADCDMGNLDIVLTGSEAEHNYVIECDAGNIDIGDRSVSGVSAEKVIDNGAASNFEIKCGLGNITVDFED